MGYPPSYLGDFQLLFIAFNLELESTFNKIVFVHQKLYADQPSVGCIPCAWTLPPIIYPGP